MSLGVTMTLLHAMRSKNAPKVDNPEEQVD